MTAQRFGLWKVVIAVPLAATVSAFVTAGSYAVPLAAMITAVVVLFLLRRRVTDVITDERDYRVAGKAARVAMSTFSAVGALVVLVLFAERQTHPEWEPVASALAYAVCGLMLLYSLLFHYYARHEK